ncbi:UDP:flavonoid glycosyltransferase YjiC, YdhE family [Duganella sp. CF402]|uniref:glycosyltransferase n=1 Tax=unclassified Duganella TaxID=2636909 RepID=UPI0008C2530A|nr:MULTISPECIES: glycosyltransferase [unclassified Duganella]RZT11194.1 UDP:flavonoid glycosyltransferase YjiC (YdhE family) [Duganella sp. BK701]SEK76879.1 UDP:flavonoid glycosyltransferase YjiC, YdhE family [Duganella sp. CF402]
MKIGLQTWGSHGDIRPFLALAEGLQLAGHEVTLLITCVDSDAYAGVTSAAGVRIRVLVSPVITPGQGAEIGWAIVNARDPLKQMKLILQRCFGPVEDAMFAAARELAAQSDLLVGHYFMHPLQIAAEHASKPYVSVLLSHAAIPSAYSHPLGWPRMFNGFLWWLTRTLLHRVLSPYVNRLRTQLGMSPAKDVVSELWLSSYLTLVAVSPQICERQPDWPEALQVCGFLDMPNMPLEGEMSGALSSFLAAGEAPVYMTLGSWMPPDVADQTETLRMLTEAARQAGCRAVIQASRWEECGFRSDEQIIYVSASPHHLIFPRCAAVVHHGGAGTTQSATLAGKPSIVIAHISEQEHWANELRRIGVAGKLTTRRNVTAKQLAASVKALRPEMQLKAASVARAMAVENGVAHAVALINARAARDPNYSYQDV